MAELEIRERLVDPLDEIAFREIAQEMVAIAPAFEPTPHRALPAKVDLGKHLHYVRRQGGSGCFAFALLAVWDIMNEMACPYTPNLSVAPWMFLHRRRDMWEQRGGVVTRDGRFIAFKTGPEYGLLQEYGNPTEATELIGYPASPWSGITDLVDGQVTEKKVAMFGWSVEGVNEAAEYRLDGPPQPLKHVNSATLMAQLAAGHPMRVTIPGHFLALVGYDATAQTFTYVDSAGDKRHKGGFGTVSFLQVDDPQKPYFSKAEVIKIVTPRPVPAARIHFTHTNRMNVGLWLSVEGSPIPRRQIWPTPQYHDDFIDSYHSGRWMPWDDNSANLHFTVRLPTEFLWPPAPGNRLVLDLHDSGAFTTSGGQLEEFTVAFGGDVRPCTAVAAGPVQFGPHSHQRFFIG
jgi:hypothetical protein